LQKAAIYRENFTGMAGRQLLASPSCPACDGRSAVFQIEQAKFMDSLLFRLKNSHYRFKMAL
jgi:hypothetical protein